ncbi:DNA-binding response OmpR family regulator [Saccharomonospora amisosensis]|uniref:DNA-binding response OmpR family regulator n=1 Tax=Saccharomonospora amisosensis TaxID=1128677 RepID=A0A7X5UMQ2_9PSEU|nr:response regulator [Saccharomonospora amisosensis]NIJ10851.1 DNA-binding response OmpR family regulator [Saccharomonospora amisosensis]
MTTILVVDDDADIRDLVAFKLEMSGYDVNTVGDGPAALSAIADNQPDLVVLDVMMPGMSGYDVCRQLREEPATRHLPIIMLTARAQDRDVDTGFSSGADDYVVKPFNPQELLRRVSALLGRARRQ